MSAKMDVLGRLLLELEKQLMDPEFRRDRAGVTALLHEDFREFGSSGREWSREGILDLLQAEALYLPPDVDDFNVRFVAPTIALVTYRAVQEDGSSLRSSLWVSDGDCWRMLFHQGTKIRQA